MAQTRQPAGTMQFIKPSNIKFTDKTGPLIHEEGRIDHIKYPHVIETYIGRAIVMINGKVITGNLPLISMHMIYSLILRKTTHHKYGVQYEIVDYGPVPFRPIPFTYLTLKMLLINEFGLTEMTALEFVCELKQQLNGKSILDVLDLSQLVKLKTPQWLFKMCNELIVFKCEYLSKLSKLWEVRSLSRLSVKELFEVADYLRTDPSIFCFSWRHPFPLTELKMSQLSVLDEQHVKPLEDPMKRIIGAYSRAKAWTHDTRQLFFTDRQLGLATADILVAVKEKIFIPIWEKLPTGSDKCWYTYENYKLLVDLKYLMNRLLERTEDAHRKKAKPYGLNELTDDEQRPAYDALTTENLIIVSGKGGTGKTKWLKAVADTYKKKVVLVCAAYGRMASNLKEKIGSGETILMHLTRLEKNPEAAQLYEVLVIDEAPLMPLSLLVRLLRVLSNLKKEVLCGDLHQMTCIDPGDSFEAYMKRYEGTKHVHMFTHVFRVTDKTGKLEKALDKVLAGEIDIDTSDDLDSDHPVILLPRSDIDPAAEDTPWEVECMQASLAPILERYELKEVQILCQRRRERDLINHAIFNLSRNETQQYDQRVFHVGEQIVFTENNYGTTDGPPHIRSSAVMNGQVREIASIYDVDPFAEPETARKVFVSGTEAPKDNLNYHRIIEFRDKSRVNLRYYDIANISKGYALTNSSAQGSQFKTIVFYIHDRFTSTLTVQELYMVLSRAERRCIIVGTQEELGRIIRTPYIRPLSPIANWLP